MSYYRWVQRGLFAHSYRLSEFYPFCFGIGCARGGEVRREEEGITDVFQFDEQQSRYTFIS